jgi:DNA-binding winged helix-turn-helix (wHTH) protein
MLPKNFEKDLNGFGESADVYEFGPFHLDTRERSLKHHGQIIPVKPKTFEILEVLAANINRVVTKEEMIESVWKDAYVEDANLSVHISTLRKILDQYEDSNVSIETIPKTGYRLKVKEEQENVSEPAAIDTTAPAATVSAYMPNHSFGFPTRPSARTIWTIFFAGLIIGILTAAAGFYWLQGHPVGASANPPKVHSFKTVQCSRDAAASSLEAGGCEEAVSAFTETANPNGNWSYGYTPRDDIANFNFFTRAQHNNHFGSPEVPVDTWSREDEWHPMILRNNSHLTIVIQEGFVVPPNMFEMHPGPNGERSTLRWTAPAAGHFRAQGQFRGLNTNTLPGCRTSTDALVVHNSEIRFSDNVEGYNIEKPFNLTFKVSKGDTIDFSVGYGANKNYECDSTGFSVMITTIALENSGR